MAIAITHAHVFYPGKVEDDGTLTASTSTAGYDLRKIVSWTETTRGGRACVQVRMQGLPEATALTWDKATFVTAKNASLTAGG